MTKNGYGEDDRATFQIKGSVQMGMKGPSQRNQEVKGLSIKDQS